MLIAAGGGERAPGRVRDPGLLRSGRERWRAWRLDRRTRSILASIDPIRLEAIRRRHRDADPDPGYSKYLDVERWMRVAVDWVYALGLQRGRSRDVLDLGTGCGYFPYACGRYGHRVHAIDLGDNDCYDEMIELLGVARTNWGIRAGEPLPRFERRFDQITAFMICFNNHYQDDVWGASEWKFFLRDLQDHHLAARGRVLLQFNPEPDGRYFPLEVEALFRRMGAVVGDGIVEIDAPYPIDA